MGFNDFVGSTKLNLNKVKTYSVVSTASNDVFEKNMHSDMEKIDYGSYEEVEENFFNTTTFKAGSKGISKFASGITDFFLSEVGVSSKFYGGVAAESFVILAADLLSGQSIDYSLLDSGKTLGIQGTKKFINKRVEDIITESFKKIIHLPKEASSQEVSELIYSNMGTTFGNTFSQFGAVFGINIVFNIASDIAGDLIKGEDVEVQWGTDIYKGAVMCVFKFAGKFIGTWFGGKVTEAAFNSIGAFVSETTVNLYDTEEARGAAGVAVVVGGALGLVTAIAIFGNPVGWVAAVVGVAIIAGAALGAVVIYFAEKVAQNWDKIMQRVDYDLSNIVNYFVGPWKSIFAWG